jgi:hypothetical protein
VNALLAKLVANGLYAELRANRWRGPRSTRDLNNYGDTKPYRAIAKGAVPKSPKMNATITQAEKRGIACIITPDHRNTITTTIYAHLTLNAYTQTLTQHSAAANEEWALALSYSDGPPFDWHHYRGEANLIKRWDPWLTPHCYAILHALVNRATTGTITDDDFTAESSSTGNADQHATQHVA